MKQHKLKELESGSYGVVYAATDPQGRKIAIKENMAQEGIDFISSIKELDMLYKLSDHVNVLKIKAFTYVHPMRINFKRNYKLDNIFFQFDLADCDLKDMIDNKAVEINKFYKYAHQLISGLCYIHANKIIHRDIKPENILYFRKDDNFKICDFGLSKMFVSNQYNTMKMVVPCYRAPEIFLNESYDYKVDVFSLGIVYYELLNQVMFTKGSKDEMMCFKKLLEKLPEETIPTIICTNERKFELFELEHKLQDLSEVNIFSFDIEEVIDKVKLHSNIKLRNLRKVPDVFSRAEFSKQYQIIKSMIRFNKHDRIGSFEVLNILSDITGTVSETTFNYKKDISIHINNNYDRHNTRSKFIDVYQKIETEEWFNFKILFSAIDLFDRYSEKVDEIHLILTCLYLSIKYNNTLTHVTSFKNLLIKLSLYSSKTFASLYKAIKELERKVIDQLYSDLFRPTIYDLSFEFHDNLDTETLLKLFDFYWSIQRNGSLRFHYKQFRSELGFLSSP